MFEYQDTILRAGMPDAPEVDRDEHHALGRMRMRVHGDVVIPLAELRGRKWINGLPRLSSPRGAHQRSIHPGVRRSRDFAARSSAEHAGIDDDRQLIAKNCL